MFPRVVWIVVSLSACKPDWVEECGCDPGQLCRRSFNPASIVGGNCISVPEPCAPAYAGDCDFDKLDDACLEAVCGEVVPSYEAGCYDNQEEHFHLMDCAYSG